MRQPPAYLMTMYLHSLEQQVLPPQDRGTSLALSVLASQSDAFCMDEGATVEELLRLHDVMAVVARNDDAECARFYPLSWRDGEDLREENDPEPLPPVPPDGAGAALLPPDEMGEDEYEQLRLHCQLQQPDANLRSAGELRSLVTWGVEQRRGCRQEFSAKLLRRLSERFDDYSEVIEVVRTATQILERIDNALAREAWIRVVRSESGFAPHELEQP